MFEELYAKIKAGGPVWIWGSGANSEAVATRLKEHGIPILGYFVDVAGATEREEVFGEVRTLSSLCEEGKPIRVVIGHGHTELAEKLQQRASIVQQVYCIPNPYSQYELSAKSVQEISEHLPEILSILTDEESRVNFKAWLSLYTESYPWQKFWQNPVPLIEDIFSFPMLSLSAQENYVDCGAWDGDTVRSFVHAVQGYRLALRFPMRTSTQLWCCAF